MRFGIVCFVLLISAATTASAQSPPPRTPGRVGGSPNNPSVLRPHAGARGVAPLSLSSLDPDEQKQFQLAQKSIPDLTTYDFFQIEYLSRALQGQGKAAGVEQLSQQIAAKDKHVVAALETFGVKKSDAKKMFGDARAAADAKTQQLAK